MIHQIILGVVAGWLLFIAFAMDTRNIRSKIVFNIFPAVASFLLGLIAFNVI